MQCPYFGGSTIGSSTVSEGQLLKEGEDGAIIIKPEDLV